MKIIANYPREKAALILIVGMMISCSHRIILSKPNTIQINGRDLIALPFIPIKEAKKDTAVKVELTDKQRLFYDKYFLPQFAALKSVIEEQSASIRSQSISIHELSDYQAITRHRTDSIAHERNSYRQLYLSSQTRDLAYQKENNRLANQLLANQKADAVAQHKQIIQNTIMTNVSLVGVVILGLMLYGIYRKVNSIEKKFGHLLSPTPNV